MRYRLNRVTDLGKLLTNWRNLLVLGTLVALGVWIFSRVAKVNPAILGDEYLYSMNARKVGPWDPSPAGDFSNYLFNFVYQTTNLCGDSFYSCAKVLNLVFFLGFIFIVFSVASRFLSFWSAYGFMVAAGLSPLGIYTSMFLPESMFFFFIGLLLLAVLSALDDYRWQRWAIVGLVIGLTSLVKPHAWLSAIAVGLTLVIVGLSQKMIGLRLTTISGFSLLIGAAFSRVVVGLLVAGPKALGFFGQYFGVSQIQQIVSGPTAGEGEQLVGQGPMNGVFALFWPQLNIHMLAVSSLMGIAIIGLAVSLIDLAKTRTLKPESGLGLFVFVWLFSLMIEIVIFTGWITGGGDDHSYRVLLRYYDFLFVIVPLSGLVIFTKRLQEGVNVFIRWGLAVFTAALITQAFTGFFGTLSIQIADAPNLAGLVVDINVFNGAAIVGFLALVIFATFPRYVSASFLILLPITLVGTGWQIQDQYQLLRADLSGADKAGQFIRENFSSAEIDQALILATSRFDATNVAIWADSASIDYELFGTGTQFDATFAPEGTSFIVTVGDIDVVGEVGTSLPGDGYSIYSLD